MTERRLLTSAVYIEKFDFVQAIFPKMCIVCEIPHRRLLLLKRKKNRS
jgi:hypothetical protein